MNIFATQAFPAFSQGGGGGCHFHLKSVPEDSSVTQAFKTHPHVTCKKGKCLEVKCQLHELKHQLPIFCFHIIMACFFLNCSVRILFSILINLPREGGFQNSLLDKPLHLTEVNKTQEPAHQLELVASLTHCSILIPE